MSAPLLSVKISAGYRKDTVLRDVEFELAEGERLGVIGSSGAGKSTLLLALLGLLPWKGGWASGEVLFRGKNLLKLREPEARKLRGRQIALVPQSPLTALNGSLSLKTHFAEAWRAHGGTPSSFRAHVSRILQRVQMPYDDKFLSRKPTEISVGQAQRITIALALLHGPSVVIADEPTSALDPVTQVEILGLLREMCDADRSALLFISHDLLSVFQLCQRVALLDQGSVAECLDVSPAIAEQVRHPAFRKLLGTLPAPPEVLLRHANERSIREAALNSMDTLPSSLDVYNLGAMVCEVISK